ncbi:hypothetical protein H5410_003015 [Solanum commersonii]|uniref:DUF4283 domain-containing protein n=1 Tax=Solanum commersonii TaxID=4109 RepID=A0A9J6B3Y0_SOLCO|nr:hypothetical protein H5410_003015 [Solanum commersonii]
MMYIEGQLLRLQVWTPTFTPEEETPIVPGWITLPELPWHCYNKEFITALLSPIGKTPSPLPKPHVWMGFDEEDFTIGKWQAIQYEGHPDYCSYCKHQGHMFHVCKIKLRDEDNKRRKEVEAENKIKNKKS